MLGNIKLIWINIADEENACGLFSPLTDLVKTRVLLGSQLAGLTMAKEIPWVLEFKKGCDIFGGFIFWWI